MSNDNVFTASNGVELEHFPLGFLRVVRGRGPVVMLSTGEQDALREFFEQGARPRLPEHWWVSPEHPGYAVIRAPRWDDRDGKAVRVVRMADGEHETHWEHYETGVSPSSWRDAVTAYFEAPPEPKPWESAKPGEVWVLRAEADELVIEEQPYMVDDWGRFVCRFGSGFGTTLEGVDVVAGRRIWPEGDDNE